MKGDHGNNVQIQMPHKLKKNIYETIRLVWMDVGGCKLIINQKK